MNGRGWRLLAGAPLLAAAALATAAAKAPGLIGTFVGQAEETDFQTKGREERNIDIIIAPHEPNGLKVSWTNVTLVDGRRDVPGVMRRSDEVILTPAKDRSFYLAGASYDPFHKRSPPDPLAGDLLRWGVLDGPALHVYSFAILEDGRYELQTHTREASPEGMTLAFERNVDGEVVRRMTGNAVRVDDDR